MMPSAPYVRTPEQKQRDFQDARAFEQDVLPPHRVTRFDAVDELDICVPGYWVECKEKRQRLTDRWLLLPGVPESDVFVIDELSVRRALKHYESAYFLIADRPGNRLFIASALELACVERVRVSRNGKAKIVVSLQNFRQLAQLEDLQQFILGDLARMPWKQGSALSPALPVKEIS